MKKLLLLLIPICAAFYLPSAASAAITCNRIFANKPVFSGDSVALDRTTFAKNSPYSVASLTQHSAVEIRNKSNASLKAIQLKSSEKYLDSFYEPVSKSILVVTSAPRNVYANHETVELVDYTVRTVLDGEVQSYSVVTVSPDIQFRRDAVGIIRIGDQFILNTENGRFRLDPFKD